MPPLVLEYPTHAFRGRGWPSSAAEEATLAADLRQRAGRQDAVRVHRDDYTTLLGALRTGLTFAELAQILAGVRPAALHAVYVDLTDRIAASTGAWHQIVANPTVDEFTENSEVAKLLVPVAVHHAEVAFQQIRSAPPIRALILGIQSTIRKQTGAVLQLERKLATARSTRHRAELGEQLLEPDSPVGWQSPFFMPQRVVHLTPTRLAYLLGEIAPSDQDSSNSAQLEVHRYPDSLPTDRRVN